MSSDVQVKAVEVIQLLVDMKAFNQNKDGVAQFLPAISSICCKSLSHDYKTTSKLRQTLIRLWNTILNQHVVKLK